MKHITDEAKTFEDLDAVSAVKVISYENSIIKMHNYANYKLFKSITQEHTQCKCITTEHGNHDYMVNMVNIAKFM